MVKYLAQKDRKYNPRRDALIWFVDLYHQTEDDPVGWAFCVGDDESHPEQFGFKTAQEAFTALENWWVSIPEYHRPGYSHLDVYVEDAGGTGYVDTFDWDTDVVQDKKEARVNFGQGINFFDMGLNRATVQQMLKSMGPQGDFRITDDTVFFENPNDAGKLKEMLMTAAKNSLPQETAKEIADGILENVRQFKADEISYEEMGRVQRQLWDLAKEKGIDDAVFAFVDPLRKKQAAESLLVEAKSNVEKFKRQAQEAQTEEALEYATSMTSEWAMTIEEAQNKLADANRALVQLGKMFSEYASYIEQSGVQKGAAMNKNAADVALKDLGLETLAATTVDADVFLDIYATLTDNTQVSTAGDDLFFEWDDDWDKIVLPAIKKNLAAIKELLASADYGVDVSNFDSLVPNFLEEARVSYNRWYDISSGSRGKHGATMKKRAGMTQDTANKWDRIKDRFGADRMLSEILQRMDPNNLIEILDDILAKNKYRMEPYTEASVKKSAQELDILRDVDVDGFRLMLYDTHRRDERGQTIIGYKFFDKINNGKVLFEGEDFAGSPMNADDSDESVRALLSFLTLRPGDTDADYFSAYNEDQMDFAQSDAEQLQLHTLEQEEGQEPITFKDWAGPKEASVKKHAGIGTEVEGVDEENNVINYIGDYGPGKFSDNVTEYVYDVVMNGGSDVLGDEYFGTYDLVTFDPPMKVIEGDKEMRPDQDYISWQLGGAIMYVTDQGFVEVSCFDTVEQAKAEWTRLEAEYEKYLEENPEEEGGM